MAVLDVTVQKMLQNLRKQRHKDYRRLIDDHRAQRTLAPRCIETLQSY